VTSCIEYLPADGRYDIKVGVFFQRGISLHRQTCFLCRNANSPNFPAGFVSGFPINKYDLVKFLKRALPDN
jgi:hypothetical protein